LASRRLKRPLVVPSIALCLALAASWPGVRAHAGSVPLTITQQGSLLVKYTPIGPTVEVKFAIYNGNPTPDASTETVQMTPATPWLTFTTSANASCTIGGTSLNCQTSLNANDTATIDATAGPAPIGQDVVAVGVAGPAGPAGAQFPVAVPGPPGPAQINVTPPTGREGDTFSLTATGGCNFAPCTDHWQLDSQPANGNSSLSSATGANPTLLARAAGAYAVSVVVTDTAGNQSPAGSTSISVDNVAPTVEGVSTNPATPVAGSPVQVKAQYVDPGCVSATDCTETYAYDWGVVQGPSGETLQVNDPTAASPTFTPDVFGDYTVTIKVTDSNGSGSLPFTITIHVGACTTCTRRSLAATGTVSAAVEGSQFTSVIANFADADGNTDPSAYAISVDWGDPTVSPGLKASGSGPFSVTASHTYAEEGTYSVSVTIADLADGDVATAISSVTVGDPSVVPAPVTMSTSFSGQEGTATAPQVLAVFRDPAGPEPLGNYSAVISWGDGTPNSGATVAIDTGSEFFDVLAGSHTFTEEGNYNVTITVMHDQAAPATMPTVRATISDPAVVASPSSFGPSPFRPAESPFSFSDVVATFIDPAGAEDSSNYSARIDWGDGNPSSRGTIVPVDGGKFSVTGLHQYLEEGTYHANVTITHELADSAAVVTDIPVDDAAVNAVGGYHFVGVEGHPRLFANPQIVASFTDPGGAEPLADYRAVIVWGDGSLPDLFAPIALGSSGAFLVESDHIYKEEGNYKIMVIIGHEDAPAQVVFSDATVDDPPVFAVGTLVGPFAAVGNEGAVINPQIIAAFTDPGGPEPVADYQAFIDWGDGSSTAGVISPAVNAPNVYVVAGAHQYIEEGFYRLTITITHDHAPPVVVNGDTVINDAQVLPLGGFTVNGAEGTHTGMQAVATFFDSGGPETLADYSASIDWGDGTPHTPGVIAYDSVTKRFTVSGDHTYAEEGQYPVRVRISHDASIPATTSSTAEIKDAPLQGAALSITDAGGREIKAGHATGVVQVAAFSDADPNGTASDYIATIDWGDGTVPDVGTVASDGAGGFTVSGDHTYEDRNLDGYTVTVVVCDTGGSSVTLTSTAIVKGRK